jgi:hypothetical protein
MKGEHQWMRFSEKMSAGATFFMIVLPQINMSNWKSIMAHQPRAMIRFILGGSPHRAPHFGALGSRPCKTYVPPPDLSSLRVHLIPSAPGDFFMRI